MERLNGAQLAVRTVNIKIGKKLYNNDESRFQTNFADCHPIWQKAVVDLVPVTHSTWSIGLIICVLFCAFFNLATLIYGNYSVFKQALAKGVLEFNQYGGIMRYRIIVGFLLCLSKKTDTCSLQFWTRF